MIKRYSNQDMQFLKHFDQIDDSLFSKIGGKNTNLVLLRRSGFSVPDGYCVTTDPYNLYLKTNQLPEGLAEEIAHIRDILGGKIVIRSSANCEDGRELSMAGVFTSLYIDRYEEISDAVELIYRQSRSEDVRQFMKMHGLPIESIRMGLVVQRLVEPDYSGVIYTGVNGDNVLVQYVDGYGVDLVDGKTSGSQLIVNREGTILKSVGFEIRPLPIGVIQQLTQDSYAIEDLFQGVAQDIEFASVGRNIHILQARTLTAELGKVDIQETIDDTLEFTKIRLRKIAEQEKRELGTPNAIFCDGNYSELLPRPKEMDIGIHSYVWGGSDGIPGAKQLGHKSMGYLVGDEANPIILYIGGRTYFSIGRYAGLYHIGFPETTREYNATLVSEYLDAVQKDTTLGSYPQMGLFIQDPTLDDLLARFGDRAHEYFGIYQEFVARMSKFADEFLSEFNSKRLSATLRFLQEIRGADLGNMTDEQLVGYALNILEHNRTESYLDFVKCARLGFYYSQRLQNLLREKLGIREEEAQRLYSRLNQGLDGSAITESNMAIAEADSDDEALKIAKELIGHFSTGEMLEIRHKPMRDSPDKLSAYVYGIRKSGSYRTDFENQRRDRINTQKVLLASVPKADRDELARVMSASQTYMAARETAKYYLTKEYLFLRDALELLGKRKGLKEGDIFHLYPRELPQFAHDPKSLLHLIHNRKQSFKNYAALELPSVIRESDIANLSLSSIDDKVFKHETGKFLAEGPEVRGIVVNLDEYGDLRQVNEIMEQYREQGIPIILAATQLNLSHDPLIAQSAGLVIRNAGIVAHGAQRARELGKGAIGGIDTRVLNTGIEVLFNPASRKITNLSNE